MASFHRCARFFLFATAWVVSSTAWLAVEEAEQQAVYEILEVKLKFADCPVPVQKTLQREAIGATINDVFKESNDARTIYKADVTFEDNQYEILVAEGGTLLEKALVEEQDDDEEQTEIEFADCPAAVQKTFKREANGAEVASVMRETADGETSYSVKLKIDDQDYEIAVDGDGTLISKTLEVDDEEVEQVEVVMVEQRKPGRKIELKLDGSSFEIKTSGTGIVISFAGDDENDDDDDDK